MRMTGTIIAALLIAISPAENDAAWADYERIPDADKPNYAYLSLSDTPEALWPDEDSREQVAAAIVCSLSSNSHLPSQRPVRLPGSEVLRLDLAALGWEGVWRQQIVEHYPYRKDLTDHSTPPLCVSANWFVAAVTDPIKTGDMQYQLLYQGKPPKTLAEFQAAWKIDPKSLPWGFIEGNSGVSVNKKRSMASFPTARRGGSAWGTFDFRKLDEKTDPLENLVPFSHDFDAQEWIAPIIKTDGKRSGAMLAWWLNDAKGNRQDKAPADIVVDSGGLRGPEIRNTISCYSCHSQGFVAPTVDEYDRFFRAGAQAKAYDKQTLRDIEDFYEADVSGDLKACQTLYASGVDMVCGMTPEKFTAAFVAAVRAYDAEVTLDQAAREVGCTPEELKLSIAYQSANGINVGARLAQLPHGVAIARDRWEELVYNAQIYVKAWRSK